MSRWGAWLGAWLAVCGFSQELTLRSDRTNGVYDVGQTIVFRVNVRGDGAAAVTRARYALKTGGLTLLREGEIELRDGGATLDARLDEPGTILAEARIAGAGGKAVRALAGAVVAPDRIRPSAPCPDDFDAFWKSKLSELAAVPAHPVLERADAENAAVEYFRITMANIRDSRIHGQLARPKAGEKFPAMLVVQWAGVYPLQKGWVTGPAAEGFLTLNINPHDLPIDRPEAFYKEQSEGPLKNYPAIGHDDRETSYFLRMYLSGYRAAEYLTQRPDWDGRTLAVTGTSQGGLQSILIAGLHPRITAVMANVPAGCDHTGDAVGRASGWPQWNANLWGKDKEKVRTASRYYDVVNFAARVKCPVLVSMGFIDETCPPAGILAACSQLKGPCEKVFLPLSDHHGNGNAQAAYYARAAAWRAAMLKGAALPPE